jgi:2-polyprenyl-6-methoxyphenol hydroxylase-like FAD-dependent oxidoreductase
MKKQPEKQVDVVGAGPVGFLTAIDLTLGSARVLVLERLATGWQRTESS